MKRYKIDWLKRALTVLVSGVLLVSWAHAAKPTYKCKNLNSSIEELVCKDGKLGELDQKVQAEYRNALKKLPKSEISGLKAEQRGWIKGRNDCWKAQDKRSCVEFSYNNRITELQIMAGNVIVPEERVFDCGNQQAITAYFYNNTQIPAAVLNFATEQVLTHQEGQSAGGTNYEGPNVSFWNKGNAAQVTWKGKALKCVEIPSSPE